MDKDKAGEVAAHTFDELQRIILSFIPGGAIIDGFLGYWSRLKQKRAIDFSEGLKKILEERAGKELTSADFENEDFVDIMESTYHEVICTQSLYKVERFRNILFKQIISPIDNQLTLKYINMTGELTDVQLLVLKTFSTKDSFRDYWDILIDIWKTYIPGASKESFDHKNADFTINLSKTEIVITKSEIQFYLADLINKGLVVDNTQEELSIPNMKFNQWPDSSGKRVAVSKKKKEQYSITEIGKKLIAFIETPD